MTEAAPAPWPMLRDAVGVPLHPGGQAATAALLDRASVVADSLVVDVGCGDGAALDLARERGAAAIGVDVAPAGPGTARGEMTALPVATDVVDVVLSECTLCLAADVDAALSEAHRVLSNGGRLAVSEMTVAGALPDLPSPIRRALCLQGRRDESWIVDRIEAAGFAVRGRRSHRDDLLAMRDELAEAVDYRGLLRALGEDGQRLLKGVDRLETAVEEGTVGYVSVVAEAG